MGKYAARQSLDKAGHDGPITSGSNNVTTGGFPAARIGDTFICKIHGQGFITEGSKTVTINGQAAARMGDKVVCGQKSLSPTKGPRLSESNFTTLAKKTKEDGSLKVKNPDVFRMNVLLASSTLLDSDRDGNFDSLNSKATIIDYKLNHPIGDSSISIGGSVGKIDMVSGTIDNTNEHSATYNAKLTGVSGNIGINSGKEGTGNFEEIKAEGSIGVVEAKAEKNISYDEDNMSGGLGFELGAEAVVAKGEGGGSVEYKYLKVKSSIAVSAGSVGAGIGGGIWWDLDNIMLRIKLTGELTIILGVKGDTDVQIGPFLETPSGIIRLMLGSIDSNTESGSILSGMTNVIIGG